MIFEQLIKAHDQEVKDGINELFDVAFANQLDENDMLLVTSHCHRMENWKDIDLSEISPFVVGVGVVGHEEHNFYEFYHEYRQQYYDKDVFDAANSEEKEKAERLTINIEFMIYLKLWENDAFLRRIFNLVRLCNKDYYRWDFKPDVFDSRERLIRNKIMQRVKKLCPKFYALLEEIYIPQLRGAFAHNKYFFSGKYISITNKNYRDGFDLGSILIDDWYKVFNKSVLLYNHYLGALQRYKEFYITKAKEHHNGLGIYTPEENPRTGGKTQRFLNWDGREFRWA